MTDQPPPYTIDLTRPARRALAEHLPLDVVIAVTDFLAGPLSTNPHRVGKRLDQPMADLHAARIMREWRILYAIDDDTRTVYVRTIRHRRDVYRTP